MVLHLNDVIDYKRDIEPFRFIEIHAGPGAGKNTFIETLAQGAFPNAPKMRVLLITSRRAKVDETFTKYDNDENDLNLFQQRIGEAWDMLDEQGRHIFATIGNTICTAAFVASYIKKVFKANDKRTHIWDMYDLIAIDEAHSMMLDATYQDAPFHIYNLINYYLERCINEEYEDPACKHMILMTGTPDPLQSYFPENDVPHIFLDKMEQCENIQPKNVYFIENQDVVNHLKNDIKNGKRCIYFGNRIDRIKEIFNSGDLPQENMVLSFSDKEKRRNLENENIDAFNNMEGTEREIKKHFRIPMQFSVLLTTSRYREGINIKDNIDEIIIETHNKSDAIQMAGRIRSGVKEIYIVVDAKSYPVDYYKEEMEKKLSKIQLWGSTNTSDLLIRDTEGNIDKRCYPLNYMLNEIPDEQLQKFVDLVEEKFPYIRYSFLYACFMFYDPRATGVEYIKKENSIWEAGVKNNKIHQVVKNWFPNANIHKYVSSRENNYALSWDIWNKYQFRLNTVYEKEKIDAFTKELSAIWGYKQINRLLSMFSHYRCVKAGSDKVGKKGRKFVE